MWRDVLLSLLLVAAAALPSVCSGQPLGLFTIVDGDVTVIRESARFPAVEGLRVQLDDIVHTGGGAPLARIELADGGVLDLGPATRLLLHPRFSGESGARPVPLYLQRGWAKLAPRPPRAATAGAAPVTNLASPRFDVTRASGAVVVQAADDASAVFVESGHAEIAERRGDGGDDAAIAATHALREGESYVAGVDGIGTVVPRLPAELRQRLPQPFTVSLPLRADRFGPAYAYEPVATREIDHDDVAHWIDAEPALRPAFRERWAHKAADDAAFRAALMAGLKQHPEWARVLHAPSLMLARRAAAADRQPSPDAAPRPPSSDAAPRPPSSDAAHAPSPRPASVRVAARRTTRGLSAPAPITPVTLPPSPPVATVVVPAAAAERAPGLQTASPWSARIR